jgi:LmbE family N-acetylglucosaminyl deacetylase
MKVGLRPAGFCAALGLAGWAGAGAAPLQPPRPDAAAIQLALNKLQVLESVLYVAAHPDDENTRLIACLVNGRLADTAYLSMTRGDGGQNLIGPEIGELLGVIRSQELLAARRIDGGRQFFTRAIDFGFSKTPEETLAIWDREQVLSDVVRVYRQFQPDVVITRFPLKDTDTHGNHTASAMLAKDAFAAAGDPKMFPDQLTTLKPWRPKRLFWNTSPFWYDNKDDFKPETMVKIDVGGFAPLLGESYPELAARSRSMHRSQGFGASGSRADVTEYLERVDGDPAKDDPFEGVDTTWSRVPGGAPIGAILARAAKEFDPQNPSASVPRLLEARKGIDALPEGRWRTVKLAEIDQVLAACLGLYLEAAATEPAGVAGGKVSVAVEAANRSPVTVRVGAVTLAPLGESTPWDQTLAGRASGKKTIEAALPVDLADSEPYWLRQRGTQGMFRVDDAALIGMPENPPALSARFAIEVNGSSFTVERPVVYKWTDPARGERYRPFEIVPAVTVEFDEKVLLFPDTAPREVAVRVRAGRPDAQGAVRLEAPSGWGVTPASRDFALKEKDATAVVAFTVRAPASASSGALRAVAEMDGRRFERGLVRIQYDHIPTQTILPQAEARVVRLALERKGQQIGYVQGAGDQIPAGLRQIGYTVTELGTADLLPERLRRFDAVVLGVRAYNTLEGIRFRQPALFDYAKAGGTLVVQYTTPQEIKVDAPLPLPLKLSRDRVSEEQAEVKVLLPDHAVMNRPNRIGPADFDGWVQERGLYFANEWDPAWQAILSCHDANEPPRNGGLLVAPYGKGYVVYTGYSWFRQFPAGVPGAIRLFVNLLSLGRAPAAS